jgi:predicted nucleic acid-binding protein
VAAVSAPAVVDSSVAYKWLQPLGEDHVVEAIDLLRQHLAGAVILVAPSVFSIEVANALRWKRRLSSSEVVELISDLETFDVRLFDVTYQRLTMAIDLAYRHNLAIYDALFLQLAEELDCPLITADRRAFAGIDSPVEIRLL